MEGKIEDLMNMCFYTNEIDEITSMPNDTKAKIPVDWNLMEIENDKKSGFVGAVYKKNDSVAIVIKGSDFVHLISGIKDYVGTNLAFVLGKQPIQYEPAKNFYNSIKQKYGKDNKIMLVGSSLGGGLAQYLGAMDVCKDKIITFSPVGTGRSVKKDLNNNVNKDFSNIYNFVVDKDFVANFVPQNGNVHYIIGPEHPNESTWHRKLRSMVDWSEYHRVSMIKDYTPKEVLNSSVDNIDKVFDKKTPSKLDIFDLPKNAPFKVFQLPTNPVKTINKPQVYNNMSNNPIRLNH
ncbi:MAG: hypothetical protein WCK67_07145 [bacterium]